MDDLISRADVERTVEDNILCYTHSDSPDTECHMAIRTALRMLRKDLRKLPSIQPKRGKWIERGTWSEGYGMGETYGKYWACNQCGREVKGFWDECGKNFCDNCGADMRGKPYADNN